MTQRSRWAFSRLAKVASAIVAVVLFGAGSLVAQGTTGKIEGTIKDKSGAPIAGAQVLIVGAAYHAVSDEKGYFFLNNVPAGVVTVRAQYIGYAPAEVRNVRVFAGQTMTVNPELEARAIEIGQITVTVEQNPIVPRDQVASKPIVQGDVINELPVDAVSQVLRLQPGVVEGSRGLSIRGSRPGDQATYIDGVLVKNFNGAFSGAYGRSGLGTRLGTSTVGTNSLEEASVTTGSSGAEYGEAGAGVISLVTRAGGPQFHGSLSYATDNLSGQVYGTGLNRVEASLSGPIMQNLTFFLGTTLQGQQNGLRPLGAANIPYYVLAGYGQNVMVPMTPGTPGDSQLVRLPVFRQFASGCGDATGMLVSGCNSTRLENANSDSYTLDGKLQYTYGSGSRLSATLHRTRNQGLGGAPQYDPVAQTGSRNISNAIIGSWTQNLASSSEHALFLDANVSWQRDQSVAGIVLPSWMENHQDPFGWFNASDVQFVTDLKTFPINDRLIENLRLNNCLTDTQRPQGACIPYLNRGDINLQSPYRFSPFGLISTTAGINNYNPTLSQETRFTGRANIDWQANRYNRVRAGFDFTNFDDLAWGSGMNSMIFMNAYKVSPKKSGFYGQDRIDLGDVVIELGLRYDDLNSGILYPRIPSRVFTDPFRSNTTLASKLAQAYSAQDSAMARACDAAITAKDSLALSTCNFFKAPAVNALSPSVRVSFPVTDRTGFRLSYSHQVETPDVSIMAAGTNSDFSNTNLNDQFARPLDFGKTIMFEFGIRHAFSDDMVLDISAYNKDLVSEVAGRTLDIYDPAVGGNKDSTNESINLYTNRDFGNVRGVDIRLDRRFGSIFQGTLAYTFQTSRTTGSDPNEYLNTVARQNSAVTGLRLSPPQALLTSADNRTHTIAGNLAANFPHAWQSGTLWGTILQDAGIFATFRFASGLPYTLMVNGGAGTLGPGNGFGLSGQGLETLNNSNMPWIKNVDLRVTKGFKVAGKDISVFADFRNLFNWTNLNNIFAETGDVVNAQYQNATLSPVYANVKADAGNLWLSNVPLTIGGVTHTYTGVDLRDCTKYAYGAGGTKGMPDCLMLQQTEARFGNGDKIFTTDEQATAFNTWYNTYHGPWTLNNNGFNMRLGFEFNF